MKFPKGPSEYITTRERVFAVYVLNTHSLSPRSTKLHTSHVSKAGGSPTTQTARMFFQISAVSEEI